MASVWTATAQQTPYPDEIVVGWDSDAQRYRFVVWTDGGWNGAYDAYDYDSTPITHWTALPDPPGDEGG